MAEEKFRYYITLYDKLAQGEHFQYVIAELDKPIETAEDVLALRRLASAAEPEGEDFELDDIIILGWTRIQ